jgi:hypothetical protein
MVIDSDFQSREHQKQSNTIINGRQTIKTGVVASGEGAHDPADSPVSGMAGTEAFGCLADRKSHKTLH